MQEHIFGEIKHLRNGAIKATGEYAVSAQVKISDITNIQYNNVFQAKVEIYDSIEKITDIGLIKPIRPNYFIALKNEKFTVETFQKSNGDYNYYVEDKQGFLQFFPSGIFENSNCIKRGEINTVAETDSRLMLFKELKKSILKNSMKINRGISTYVGKSIIENKEKYRIPYGSPASPPEEDFDISDMVWEEKKEKRLKYRLKN